MWRFAETVRAVDVDIHMPPSKQNVQTLSYETLGNRHWYVLPRHCCISSQVTKISCSIGWTAGWSVSTAQGVIAWLLESLRPPVTALAKAIPPYPPWRVSDLSRNERPGLLLSRTVNSTSVLSCPPVLAEAYSRTRHRRVHCPLSLPFANALAPVTLCVGFAARLRGRQVRRSFINSNFCL